MRRFRVPVSLLTFVLACSLTSCGQTRSPEIALGQPRTTHGTRVAQTRHATPEPSRAPSTPGRRPGCHADGLRLRVALSDATMSQPFADISITNTGAHTCALIGYPRIAVAGHRGFPDQPAPAVPVAIAVRHRIYERVDPGPHQVRVSPGHHVFFSIGTVDADDGPLFTLTRLTITLPGTRRRHMLAVGLLADGPPGRKIPVGITAITRSPRA